MVSVWGLEFWLLRTELMLEMGLWVRLDLCQIRGGADFLNGDFLGRVSGGKCP